MPFRKRCSVHLRVAWTCRANREQRCTTAAQLCNGKYAYGVFATSAAGDVGINNAAGGEIGFYSYLGRGFGVLGIAYSGDVGVVNAGTIEGYAYGQAVGVFALAAAGGVA